MVTPGGEYAQNGLKRQGTKNKGPSRGLILSSKTRYLGREINVNVTLENDDFTGLTFGTVKLPSDHSE